MSKLTQRQKNSYFSWKANRIGVGERKERFISVRHFWHLTMEITLAERHFLRTTSGPIPLKSGNYRSILLYSFQLKENCCFEIRATTIIANRVRQMLLFRLSIFKPLNWCFFIFNGRPIKIEEKSIKVCWSFLCYKNKALNLLNHCRTDLIQIVEKLNDLASVIILFGKLINLFLVHPTPIRKQGNNKQNVVTLWRNTLCNAGPEKNKRFGFPLESHTFDSHTSTSWHT